MKVSLEFNDLNDDRINEQDMVYENYSAPIPNVKEVICLGGINYIIHDRYFMYFKNLDVDLQIVFRCKDISE